MTTFFSENLVSREFVERLQGDLRECLMCRFLVAYVSNAGICTIGRPLLVDAMSKTGSFGISSLSCSCGFDPLLDLQGAIGSSRAKLKYFMDPIVRTRREPRLVLLHSKLIYLAIPSQGKSVVYIGSHNWTGSALSDDGTVNAEASLRIEVPYDTEHAYGRGDSIAGQVNRHLLEAKDLPACRDAVESNRQLFEQWYDKGCRTNPSPSTDDAFILLAVLKDAEPISPSIFDELVDKGIYLRTDNTGKRMYLAEHRRLIIMLWLSESDLQNGQQPILIRCRRSTDAPDVSADVKSTNTSPSPIEGFGAAIFGSKKLTLWSGREAQAFDFAFQSGPTSSQSFDTTLGGRAPKYRFHLEVMNVVFPAFGMDELFSSQSASSEQARAEPQGDEQKSAKPPCWYPDSFAVANKRKDFAFIGINGYLVGEEDEQSIAKCFKDVFSITENDATVWPTSKTAEEPLGNFVSSHPLHETYLHGIEHQSLATKVKDFAKALIPQLPKEASEEDGDKRTLQAITRVQHGVVRQLDELFGQWHE
ncbi:phospholipase D-like domain-containing protein [Adhaeretor mobilis]|uniref:Uncharacterized protein n=1 Tax=Adhaeretor mobilis TaxID=1930276 RepID=A0A517MS30_9BACT|nr:hypothetical protein [Adhaeretor mobilis]QDS97686.1 hypothetical protein HG15A2_09500 [Adhaeretor mobilis]